MPKPSRRYELLLPTMFNDGRAVPDSLIGQTVQEIRAQFRAVSVESQQIWGYWEDADKMYRDANIRLFVDVIDTPKNRTFFVELKERLKERFGQVDIWMTTYPIDVI